MKCNTGKLAVPWLRRLVAGLSPRRHGFDPGSVRVGFVVDKVALGQVFLPVLRFSPVNFIPPVLHYTKKLIFITGLHNKPQGCGASVVICCGTLLTKKKYCEVELKLLRPRRILVVRYVRF
jgi:hypothetical protein